MTNEVFPLRALDARSDRLAYAAGVPQRSQEKKSSLADYDSKKPIRRVYVAVTSTSPWPLALWCLWVMDRRS